jgi:hypothetical protein
MKKIHATAILMLPLLFASGAGAQGIIWNDPTMQQPPYASAYLPRLATDTYLNWVFINATGPGFELLATDSGFDPNQNGVVNWAQYGPTLESPPSGGGVIGHAPSLSIFPVSVSNSIYLNDIFLEVHQGTQHNGEQLWYTLGTCALDSSYDCVGSPNWLAGQEFDAGFNPSVSIDTSVINSTTAPIVEVHQLSSSSSVFWYHVGALNYPTSTPSVVWGPAFQVANAAGTIVSGYAPSISVVGGYVVMAYQAGGGKLAYVFGKISGNKVLWQNPTNYDGGYNPSISMMPSGFGFQAAVVEAHQADSGTGPLYYRTGTWNNQSSPTGIEWLPNSSTKYAASGCYPAVALDFFNDVGELHSTACGVEATLEYSSGWEPLVHLP